MSIQIPWGERILNLNLPDSWNVTGVLEPSAALAADDPEAEEETLRALSQPVGAPRLSETARGKQRVVIVIDDSSRPTPVAKMLPGVLAELQSGGVSRDCLTVIPALGLHRPMDAAEMRLRCGAAFEGLRWENPDCDDPAKLTHLGTTSRGTPVWINSTVAAADLVVTIGCIEPHIIASFGGGYKIIVPGVAGRATVAHNHSLNCAPATFNMVGQPVAQNPMRLDLEECGGMLKPPVFILNAILDHCQEVVRIVAGDPVAAHREGARISAGMYGVKIPSMADVVITASAPMDSDLRQGVKALANTVRAVKPGGVLITLVRAVEGVGVFGLANKKLPLGRGALQALAPLLVRAVPKIKLNGMGEEDRFFLYFALQAMRRARLLMYGPTIPTATQANLPFVTFMPTPEQAIASAQEKFPGGASVLVFPHGGITYPELG